jgi:hypothetical protein
VSFRSWVATTILGKYLPDYTESYCRRITFILTEVKTSFCNPTYHVLVCLVNGNTVTKSVCTIHSDVTYGGVDV